MEAEDQFGKFISKLQLVSDSMARLNNQGQNSQGENSQCQISQLDKNANVT